MMKGCCKKILLHILKGLAADCNACCQLFIIKPLYCVQRFKLRSSVLLKNSGRRSDMETGLSELYNQVFWICCQGTLTSDNPCPWSPGPLMKVLNTVAERICWNDVELPKCLRNYIFVGVWSRGFQISQVPG